MARTTGEDTKAAVRHVALAEFAAKGYEITSLEEIANEVGITRSAILHHFGSKAELLREIVEPLEDRLDEILAGYSTTSVPLPAPGRQDLLEALVEAYCEHRQVLILLLRDVSSHWPINVDLRIGPRIARLVQLLVGDQPTSDQRLVIVAMLGVITRPLLDPNIDTDNNHNKQLILSLAIEVSRHLDQPSDV